MKYLKYTESSKRSHPYSRLPIPNQKILKGVIQYRSRLATRTAMEPSRSRLLPTTDSMMQGSVINDLHPGHETDILVSRQADNIDSTCNNINIVKNAVHSQNTNEDTTRKLTDHAEVVAERSPHSLSIDNQGMLSYLKEEDSGQGLKAAVQIPLGPTFGQQAVISADN